MPRVIEFSQVESPSAITRLSYRAVVARRVIGYVVTALTREHYHEPFITQQNVDRR